MQSNFEIISIVDNNRRTLTTNLITVAEHQKNHNIAYEPAVDAEGFSTRGRE